MEQQILCFSEIQTILSFYLTRKYIWDLNYLCIAYLSSCIWAFSSSANQCPSLPELVNGVKLSIQESYHFGDIVTFQCNIGYILQGSNTIVCQEDGSWDASLPTCTGEIT